MLLGLGRLLMILFVILNCKSIILSALEETLKWQAVPNWMNYDHNLIEL